MRELRACSIGVTFELVLIVLNWLIGFCVVINLALLRLWTLHSVLHLH